MDRNRCVTVTHEGAVSTVTFDAPPQNLLDIDLMDHVSVGRSSGSRS